MEKKPGYKELGYNNCFVAFLDILGFSKKVDSIGSTQDFSEIKEILELIANMGEQFKDIINRLEYVTVSDSIIASLPVNALGEATGSAFANLLAILQYDLYQKYNILIRGGLSTGRMYHKDNLFFGNAFLRAYYLESKIAIYPRILISKECIRYMKYIKKTDVEYNEFSFNDLCANDQGDGLVFIDFKKYGKEKWNNDLQVHCPESLKRKQDIENKMKDSDCKIAQKYKWLGKYIYPYPLN